MHVITGNLKIISDSRMRSIFVKVLNTDFRIASISNREEIAAALNDFGNRWCKREYVEPSALKNWKLSFRSFYLKFRKPKRSIIQ